MRLIVVTIMLASLVPFPQRALAEDVFDALRKEPVSMFDFGIKRLRSSAIQITRKLAPPSDPLPQVSVLFDTAKRAIDIEFFIVSRGAVGDPATCRQRRVVAIKEMLSIGATAYAAQLSSEQRVVRRIGSMFVREGAEIKEQAQAMGERLSQSINVKVTMTSDPPTATVDCSGLLNDLRL